MQLLTKEMKRKVLTEKYLFKIYFNKYGDRVSVLQEPGIVYAPYVPMFTTPIINDEFQPSKTIKSRYSLKTINFNFYSTLKF